MSFEWRVYPTPQAVASAVAAQLTQQWQAESFHLALAGGSTPRLLYQLLAQQPLPAGLHLWFSDERCVPPDHPDSNFGMAWETWLKRADIDPARIHRMRGEDPPEQAAAAYTAALQQQLPQGRFDAVLLGMGTDGHTASLFPGQAAIHAHSPCVATQAPSGQARLTLSFACLNQAQSVALLVTGSDKAERVAEALSPAHSYLPVHRLNHATWWLDAAAAAHLPQGEAYAPDL